MLSSKKYPKLCSLCLFCVARISLINSLLMKKCAVPCPFQSKHILFFFISFFHFYNKNLISLYIFISKRKRVQELVLVLEELQKLELPFNCFQQLNYRKKNDCQDNGEEDRMTSSTPIILQRSPQQFEEMRYMIETQSNNPFLKGKKGHLIYMFPLFIKLVTSRENEIKRVL